MPEAVAGATVKDKLRAVGLCSRDCLRSGRSETIMLIRKTRLLVNLFARR